MRSKGIPSSPSTHQKHFQSPSYSKETLPHVVLPQCCFSPSRNFYINTKIGSTDEKLHLSVPCCRMSLSNVTAVKANNPTDLMWFCLIKAPITHRDLFQLNPCSLDSHNQLLGKTILKSAGFWRGTLHSDSSNRESFVAEITDF